MNDSFRAKVLELVGEASLLMAGDRGMDNTRAIAIADEIAALHHTELSLVIAERDRWVNRMRALEERINKARESLEGK